MIDVLIESIPWDKVGKGLAAASVAVATWWTLNILSRAMTGESLWQNIKKVFPEVKDRLCEWFRVQRRTSNVYKGAVFVVKTIASGGRRVLAYALRLDNTRVETGVEVTYTQSQLPKNMPAANEYKLALEQLEI